MAPSRRLQHLASALSSESPAAASAPAAPAGAAAAESGKIDCLIVGAGFGGMTAIHKLRDEMGLSVQVLEQGSNVGGTWFWNRYPGARCDVHSIEYSFSWDDDLEQEWVWDEVMAAQPQILEYQNHVADRHDLRRSIQFNTRVESCTYDAAANLWHVQTAAGETFSAQFLISCVGCLSTPKSPEIPGLADFEGEIFHTGQWPHDPVSFDGKTVGLIGTGSSGIQTIPIVAAAAKHLTVFQRTPQYSLPANNHAADQEYEQTMKKNYKQLRELAKYSPAGFITGFGGAVSATDGTHMPEPTMYSILDKTEEERLALLEEHGLELFRRLEDTGMSMEANQVVCDLFEVKLNQIIDDPDMADKLTPRDQPFGCKRQVMDTGYYATYNRDNVDLVDLRRGGITTVTKTGIVTEQGETEFDILITATGYDAMTGALLAMNITGRDGETLNEHWEAGPKTYLGLQMAGFPNFFSVTGPGSPSVLSSMITSIEQHVDFIAQAIGHMGEKGKTIMETTTADEDEWVQHCNYLSSFDIVKTHESCNSWYLGANVPGKPRIFMPYLGGVGTYRLKCEEVAAAGFEGFTFDEGK